MLMNPRPHVGQDELCAVETGGCEFPVVGEPRLVKFLLELLPQKKVPASSLSESESSLARVVARERRALLIIAYGPMEAEEVLVLVGFSKVPESDSEEEVEPVVVLVPGVEDCPQELGPKDLAWHTGSFSIRASPAVIRLR